MRLAGTNRGRASVRGKTWEAQWEWEETWTLLDETEADPPQDRPEPEVAAGEVLREGRDFGKQAELERRREAATGGRRSRAKQGKERIPSPATFRMAGGEKKKGFSPGSPGLAEESEEETSTAAVAATDRRAEQGAAAPFFSASVRGEEKRVPYAHASAYRGGPPARASGSDDSQEAAECAGPAPCKPGPVGADRADDEERSLRSAPGACHDRERRPPVAPGTAAGLADSMQEARKERRRRIEWAR